MKAISKQPVVLPSIRNPKYIAKNVTPRSLTPKEEKDIDLIFQNLKIHANVVYRGIEEDETINRYLASDAGSLNFREIIPELFYFGLKAKNLLNTPELNYLAIRTSSIGGILSLCKLTSELLKTDKHAVLEFTAKNSKFAEFFKNVAEEELRKIVEGLSYWQRRSLRNLLITILHREGENNYSTNSLLVSTSKCYSIASKFTEFNDGGIVILWIPKKHRNFIVSTHQNMKQLHELQEAGIPQVRSMPEDNEHEISVFGAIFPHYIFGIYSTKDDVTYINPELFNIDANCLDLVFNGLPIDQTNFFDLLPQTTKYKSLAIHTDEGISILEIQTVSSMNSVKILPHS